MFSYLSDSAFGLGDQARGLLPGVDCPDHANFLPLTIFDQGSEKNIKERPNALCVFEHNAGIPIRRHRMEESTERANGGLADNILIVRTIITEYNYDYIFDFVFHANGILEARVYATGYIMGQWYYSGEDPFGFKVFPNLIGSIHHHLFNFKVDMDIGGTSNRYDTLDFTVNDEEWPWLSVLKPSSNASSSEGKIQQLSFTRTPKRTEKEAVYHYNFDRPKYHIFYNDQKKNDFGTHRAYRLDAVGFSKQILPSGHPAVRSRKWVENQLAVTLRKENETRSSSIFSMYDGDDPTVDFGKYIDDNDAIEDEVSVLRD
nr:hypothetical protein BaRGS_003447 [Batillaria attramentaria]